METKTVVVTGANSGIGLETAVALAREGNHVVMTARNEARGEAAKSDVQKRSGNDQVDLVCFDLSSMASVRKGAAEIIEHNERIDVLVNNAGLVLSDRQVSADGLEMTFAANHLGHFLLTILLLDRIKAAPQGRIVNVASTAHTSARHGLDFEDLQAEKHYKGMKAYGASKLANILFTTELARRLEGTSTTANSLHPGVVATGWGKNGDTKGVIGFGVKVIEPFVLTPEKGARTSVYLASSPDVAKVTGRYFAKCKEKTPSKAAQDANAARRLWDASEQLIGSAQTT